MSICAVVTAAGLSSRMGDFKPLMKIGGKTVIENTLDTLLLSGVQKTVLVLGYRGREIERLLQQRKTVCVCHNPDPQNTDMLFSVKTGILQLPSCDAFFVLPGDMPAISPQTLQTLQTAFFEKQPDVVFPLLNGKRKHPPLIHSRCRDTILAFRGEGGLRGALSGCEDVLEIAVNDAGCGIDIDTKADYTACKNYMAGRLLH